MSGGLTTPQFDSFIPCSERIVRAVTDMVLLFPEVSGLVGLITWTMEDRVKC